MNADFGSLSFILGYLLMILGDGCLLVAATVAASSGGSPLKWGLAFGLAHGTFTLIGLFIASTIAEGSELLGHLVVLFALVYLLRHFLHHRSHKGKCGCLEEHTAPTTFIWVISLALSVHAIPSGAVLQQAFPGATIVGYATVAGCSAILSGCLIALVVRFSEEYKSLLVRFFDAAPSVTVGLLSAAITYVVLHLIAEASDLHDHAHGITTALACLGGVSIGIWARSHFKRVNSTSVSVPPPLVSIRRSL